MVSVRFSSNGSEIELVQSLVFYLVRLPNSIELNACRHSRNSNIPEDELLVTLAEQSRLCLLQQLS